MHSMIIAEPVGIAIGVIAGRFGAKLGKKVARQFEIPTFIGAMLGSFLAHYAVSAIVKAMINAGMLDVPGGAANIAVTSPLAAGGHGLVEGALELFPDIQNYIAEALEVDMPQLVEEVQKLIDNGANVPDDYDVQFGTSYQPIELIADLQQGPTCGFETIENMIQAANNQFIGNDLSGQYQEFLEASRIESNALPTEYYQDFLSRFGIESDWIPFNHEAIIDNIAQPGHTVAVIGDPILLDSEVYSHGLHAITLVEPWWNDSGEIIGYIGIDSNFAGQRMHYSFEKISNFVMERKPLGKFGHHVLKTF